MGRKKSTSQKKEKKTATKVRPIPRKHAGKITEPWAMMESLIGGTEVFEHLKVAKIKLWWQRDWKADCDGVATGAQVCKASEIDRNLAEESGGETVDLFIKLPEQQWPTLDETEKRHRLFHELCHIRPSKDSEGRQKRDAKDRLLWRLRRHPITAFPEEIDEFGIDRVLGHNEQVVTSIRQANRPMEKLFDQAEKSSDGAIPVKSEEPKPGGEAAEAWKLHKLAVLEGRLTEKQFDALEATHLKTLGDLQAKMNQHGEWWAKELGIHGRHRDAIAEAFNAWIMAQQ